MILHSKGNHQQEKKKKTTFRMGENTCKWNNWKGINFQNIQTAYAAQYTKKENKNPIQSKKWIDLNRHFSKETYKWLTNTWKDTQHQ